MTQRQDKFSVSASAPFNRLRRFQISEGLTWAEVAKKLGISVSMLMMVKRGHRNLSEKAIYRLEQAEREAADRRTAAERVVESLIGQDNVVPQILGKEDKVGGQIVLVLEYEKTKLDKSLPTKAALVPPAEKDCRRLRILFAETLDTRVIVLACLPKQLRSEDFLERLTAESRGRLTNAALGLVIPDWRTLITAAM